MSSLLAVGLTVVLVATACGSSKKTDTGSATTAANNSSTTTGSGAASTASGGSVSGLPAGPIKLGLILSLTGAYAPVGEAEDLLYKTAVSVVNASGGIDGGHQVELVTENDQDDPAIAVSAAQKLLSAGVVGVLNPSLQNSFQTIPILMKAKMPIVVNDPQETFAIDPSKYPYYFDNFATFPVTARAMISLLSAKHQTNVGIISDGTQYAADEISNIEKADAGSSVQLRKPVTITPTATDVSTQIAQVKQEGVTAVILAISGNFDPTFAAIHAANWSPMIVSDAGIGATPLSVIGSSASDTYFGCSVFQTTPTGASPQLLKLISEFKAKMGNNFPSLEYSPLFVDAIDTFGWAIQQAGSTNGTKIKDAIETITNKTFSAPEVAYTWTPTDHQGSRTESMCNIAFAANGVPVAAIPAITYPSS